MSALRDLCCLSPSAHTLFYVTRILVRMTLATARRWILLPCGRDHHPSLSTSLCPTLIVHISAWRVDDSRFGLTPNPVASQSGSTCDPYPCPCSILIVLSVWRMDDSRFFLRLCVANFAVHWRDEICNLRPLWTGDVPWPTLCRPPLVTIASFSDCSVWLGPGTPFP